MQSSWWISRRLFFAGYTQDALKEYVEATLTCAIVESRPLPKPEVLDIENATYLNGLAEVTGELRRRCLDILRQGYSPEAERLLGWMDEIYNLLVTVDYPDALTNGLRRQTDLVRGIVERTRGDLTISLREEKSAASAGAGVSNTVLDENAGHPRVGDRRLPVLPPRLVVSPARHRNPENEPEMSAGSSYHRRHGRKVLSGTCCARPAGSCCWRRWSSRP